MLHSLFRLLTGKRDYLTLLIVAGTAAGLYAAFAKVRAERDDLKAMAERICASAGASFEADQGDPGVACARTVRELAAFRRDTQAATAERLIAAMQAREHKQAADARRRAAAHEAARAATATMNTAEEQIHDDEVTGSWFAALNALAGLRAPSAGDSACCGSH